MTNRRHTLMQRLAARKAIALLTGSHASFGLADRMRDFGRPEPITGEPVTDRVIRWSRGEDISYPATARTGINPQQAVRTFRARHPEIVAAWKDGEGEK